MATADVPITQASFASLPTTTPQLPSDWTLADLQRHLAVPLERIRLFPSPGVATEGDLVRLLDEKTGLCELVDGGLVGKTMGYGESNVAVIVAQLIMVYLDNNPIGMVIGESGPVRTVASQVRLPDVGFIRYERLPKNDGARRAVLPVAPDLAIEILSPSNTVKEMQRKLEEYFAAGSQLVWYIDPVARPTKGYVSPTNYAEIDAAGTLDGGDVLPGFRLSLADVFKRVDQQPA